MTDTIDPYAIAKRLLTFHDDWARKKAKADLSAERKKPVLYTIAASCNEQSAAAKEQFAYRSPEYASHLEKMVDDDLQCNLAKGKLEAERCRIEMLRTQSANERQVNRVMP